MLLRCLNLLTCGMAAGGWHAEDMRVKFDLYALRRKAANYNEVRCPCPALPCPPAAHAARVPRC